MGEGLTVDRLQIRMVNNLNSSNQTSSPHQSLSSSMIVPFESSSKCPSCTHQVKSLKLQTFSTTACLMRATTRATSSFTSTHSSLLKHLQRNSSNQLLQINLTQLMLQQVHRLEMQMWDQPLKWVTLR